MVLSIRLRIHQARWNCSDSKKRAKIEVTLRLYKSGLIEQVSKEVQETSTNEIPEDTATSVHASSEFRIALQTAQGFVTTDNGL